jgi:hypothetical protein
MTAASSYSQSYSGLESLYDRRFTANQFVLATSPLRLETSNFIFQLNIWCYTFYVTSFLTRGWVCRLQLLLGLVSAVFLRSESRRTHDILLSQIRDLPNLEGQVPICISPRIRVARLYPKPLGDSYPRLTENSYITLAGPNAKHLFQQFLHFVASRVRCLGNVFFGL